MDRKEIDKELMFETMTRTLNTIKRLLIAIVCILGVILLFVWGFWAYIPY